VEPGLAGAKCGLALLQRGNEEIRLPMLPVTPGTKETIRKAMIHAGLLNA
jgi:4-hydroxy-tetrahydrodipicolinate synthase